MNLSPYAAGIVLSRVFEALLLLASILNLMQFSVQPSLEMIPCLTAFLFSDFVFLKSRKHANMLKSSMLNISFPLNLAANFLSIALPMLLTNILFLSLVESNLMLKQRFAVPGMMMPSLPKLENLTSRN